MKRYGLSKQLDLEVKAAGCLKRQAARSIMAAGDFGCRHRYCRDN